MSDIVDPRSQPAEPAASSQSPPGELAAVIPSCVGVNDTPPPDESCTEDRNDVVKQVVERATAAVEALLPAIAGFEIMGVLGRGGMGVVYRARHEKLKRIVALKVLRAGAFAGPEELRRFRREAESVARLQHPHIVQIFEIGEQVGLPFLVLEFVDGGSLAAKIYGTPQPPREAALLVQTLAQAIQAAHQRGVVHRDLKPANVLLTADGTPKIADFGLAKRLDAEASATRSGAIVGTPSYMAPEQARGASKGVGPLVDVYALGALLFELLTGRPPFLASSAMDSLKQVLEEEPVPPHLLNPTVPRDLETICLKCLSKEPAKRYATAKELADDLGRFLADEPIRARRVGRVERLLRWCKRRPAVAGLLVALVVVFGVGVGGILGEWHRAENQAEQARAERDTAQRESQRAEANFEKAQDAVESMLTRVGTEQLAHMPHMEKLRRELLEKALKFNLEFLREKGADPGVRAAAGRAYRQVGYIRNQLGEYALAKEAFHKSIDLFIKLTNESPGHVDYNKGLANSYNSLATVLLTTLRMPEGFPAVDKVYDQVQPILEQLAADYPNDPDSRENLAVIHQNRTNLFLGLKDHDRAEASCRKAMELMAQLIKDYPENSRAVQSLAQIHNMMGILCIRTKRPAEARHAYGQAITTLEQLMAKTPADTIVKSELATTYRNLAILLRNTGERGEALKAFAQARTLFENLITDFPYTPAYRSELGEALQGTALTLQGPQTLAEARSLLEQAVQHQQAALRLSPQHEKYRGKLCNQYHCLAEVLLELGDHAEAAKAAIGMAKALDHRVIDYQEGARFLGQCVVLAEKATRLPEGKRKELAHDYAQQAVDLLRHAKAKGYFDAQHFKTHPDLNPLRSQPAYQKMLKELDQAASASISP